MPGQLAPERPVTMANGKVTLRLLTWPELVMSRHSRWGQYHPGSQIHRATLVPGLSHFLQSPGSSQSSSHIQVWHFLALGSPRQCCFQQRDASPPSPNPGRALASMTANPLHHLGLIRAQWQMISLHIKALKQLNKLAPSQSPAQELALNSEALPTGTGEQRRKPGSPMQRGTQKEFCFSSEEMDPSCFHP